MIEIKRTNSSSTDFISLTHELDKELRHRYNEQQDFFDVFNKIDNIDTVVIAFDNETAVGCGCFKPFDHQSVELKRMYVLPASRSKGIAGKILDELETWAKESGYNSVLLETGKLQPEAIHLYQKRGYSIIENFGQYIGVEMSVCMRKAI